MSYLALGSDCTRMGHVGVYVMLGKKFKKDADLVRYRQLNVVIIKYMNGDDNINDRKIT